MRHTKLLLRWMYCFLIGVLFWCPPVSASTVLYDAPGSGYVMDPSLSLLLSLPRTPGFLSFEYWVYDIIVGPGGFMQDENQIGLSIGAQASGYYIDSEDPDADWQDLGVVIGSGHTFTQNLAEVLLSESGYFLDGSGNTLSVFSTTWQVYGCCSFRDRVIITFDPVPIPAALPLLAGGLGGLGLMGWWRRRRREQAEERP